MMPGCFKKTQASYIILLCTIGTILIRKAFPPVINPVSLQLNTIIFLKWLILMKNEDAAILNYHRSMSLNISNYPEICT